MLAMAMTGSTPCSSMSSHTKERVSVVKVTRENFYSNLFAQHEEREMRQKKLEKVIDEEALKAEEKRPWRSARTRKETVSSPPRDPELPCVPPLLAHARGDPQLLSDGEGISLFSAASPPPLPAPPALSGEGLAFASAVLVPGGCCCPG